MKHELSACILIPTLAGHTVQLKKGYRYSVRVLFQLLVSMLFIAVPTITEFFLYLYSYVHV